MAAGHVPAQEVADGGPWSLARLAQFPLITRETGNTGRSHVDEAFHREGPKSDIVPQAMDADVIKTCVDPGIGVGVIASVAFDAVRDSHLVVLDTRRRYATNTTRVAARPSGPASARTSISCGRTCTVSPWTVAQPATQLLAHRRAERAQGFDQQHLEAPRPALGARCKARHRPPG